MISTESVYDQNILACAGSSLHAPLNKLLTITLGAATLLALSGCAAIKVKLGTRVYLDKLSVTSMKVSLPQGAIAPGQKLPLVVTITEPDGKTLQTEGAGNGKIFWKDLAVTASVVTVNTKGVISLARDPRISDGKTGHITVTAPSHPGVQADLDVPFRYNSAYVADFSGAPGSNGMDGLDGTNGTSGSMGSIDPNNPSPGGDGSNGSDGSNGGNGGAGGDAPPVQLRVALKPENNRPLLQIAVSAQNRSEFYLVDPRGGSLTVRADGGTGGSGGRGGRGGRGGSGGVGTPNGNAGHDGSDGLSGSNGWPGRGGLITVTYDPQAAPYIGVIHLSSQHGPAPVFKEMRVAPLW